MPGALKLPYVAVALTANGTTAGVCTVGAGNAAKFTVGARGYLTDNNQNSIPIKVIATDTTANTVTVRQVNEPGTTIKGPNYGATDVSGYTTVNGATLVQERQELFIDYTEVTTSQNII